MEKGKTGYNSFEIIPEKGEGRMAYLLSYTRQPIDSVHYDPRLACSMHLALSRDGADYDALNHNSGLQRRHNRKTVP